MIAGAVIGASASDESLSRNLTSLDAEVGVLGALLIDVGALPRVRSVLDGAHFSTLAHANIYNAVCDVYDTGAVPDSVSIIAYLTEHGALDDCGGYAYIEHLQDAMPASYAIEGHAKIVRDRWERRVAVGMLRALERSAVAGTVAMRSALDEGLRVMSALVPTGAGFLPVGDGLWEVMNAIEQRATAPASALLTTGFREFDSHYGGLRGGEVLLIAGNPGSGKSAVLSSIALHMAAQGHAVGIESCEMPVSDVIERLLASVGGVDARDLRRGTLSQEDWPKLAHAASVLKKLPLYVDDANTPTFAAMSSTYQSLVNKHGPLRMLGVDFVQLLDLGKGSAGERVERLKMIAYGLKGIAKKPHKMAVVALAQLNNKDIVKRSDVRPRLEDIQGSSAFEQAADFVWLLHVDPSNPSQIIMDVAKGRGGGKSEFLLRADFPRMRITSW